MKNSKHSLLGLLCSILLFIFLLADAFIISLRAGIFDGNGNISIAGNLSISDSLVETITENSNDILEQYGFTSETFNSLMNDDYISTVIDTAGNAILSDEPIDLSSLKDDTVDFCNNTSTILVDEFVDKLETSDGKISEATISDNSIVRAFSDNYGIDIDSEIKSAISEKYPNIDMTREIDLSAIDTKELRSTLNTAVEEKLSPRLDELTDRIISKAEEVLTDVSNTVHENPSYQTYSKMMNLVSSNITLLIVFLSLCAVFFFSIQFMLYSGTFRNRPLNNLGIASLLAAFPTIFIGYSTTILGSFIDKQIDKINSSYSSMADVIRNVLNSCLKPFLFTGFALMGIAAAAFIISIIVKPTKED